MSDEILVRLAADAWFSGIVICFLVVTAKAFLLSFLDFKKSVPETL